MWRYLTLQNLCRKHRSSHVSLQPHSFHEVVLEGVGGEGCLWPWMVENVVMKEKREKHSVVCLCVTERVLESGGVRSCGWAAAGIRSAALSCIINVKRVELKAEITCHEEQAAAILRETGLPLLYAHVIVLDYRPAWQSYFDAKTKWGAVSHFWSRSVPPPHPICFLGPQSQSLTTELRTTAKHFAAGYTAALTIQFVATQLPMWHIWCNSHPVCLNWTTRTEGGVALFCGRFYIKSPSVQIPGCCSVLSWWDCGACFLKDTFFCLLFCRLFVVNPDYSYRGFSFERAFPAPETSASSANNVHVCLGLHLFNKDHSGCE